MQFLVSALGSAGDVFPFLAISQALIARGHEVALMASPRFEASVQRAGIEFVPLGTTDDFDRLVQRAELWHPRHGTRLVIDELLQRLPEAHAVAAAWATRSTRGETALVGSTLSWHLRLLQETTGLPLATVHLSPLCLPSAFDPPVWPGVGDVSWMPAWAVRWMLGLGERLAVDRWVGPRLDRVRAGLGLAPVRRITSRWIHSPDLVIAAWPAWFAPPQADWPSAAEVTGFPRFDGAGAAGLDAALEAFLAAGPPPVGITPGSAMAHGERFFARALEACGALGQRAVLITPYAAQLPAPLPSWARHVAFAPFGVLLPCLSALVHHGGIGTSAQALAAGIPQLIVPFAHDQFDNAARLRRLGVCRVLKADASLPEAITALDALRTEALHATAVQRYAAQSASDGAGAQRIAQRLEAFGAMRRVALGEVSAATALRPIALQDDRSPTPRETPAPRSHP